MSKMRYCNAILSINKKECTDTYEIDEPQNHMLSERNQTHKNYIMCDSISPKTQLYSDRK